MEKSTLKTIGQNPDVVQPLGNYIVVDLEKPMKESIGGVLLPDQVVDRDKQMLARVIAVGPGQRSLLTGDFMPMHVRPGDLVILMRHAPVEVELVREKFYVIAEGDILGKIDEEKLAQIQADQPVEAPAESYAVAEDAEAKVTQTGSGIFVVSSG